MRILDHRTIEAHVAQAERHLSSAHVVLAHPGDDGHLTAGQEARLRAATDTVTRMLRMIEARLAGQTIDLELGELVAAHEQPRSPPSQPPDQATGDTC